MIISVETEAPVLVYKKIIAESVPSVRNIIELATQSEVDAGVSGSNGTPFKWITQEDLNNAKKVVETMWEQYVVTKDDDEEMEEVLQSILNHAKRGLHDSTIEVNHGRWYFVEKGKEREVLIKYFRDTDPEYLGGFRREVVVGCFESGYQRDMADRLCANDECETLGQAIQNHEGVLEKMVDILLRDVERHETWTLEGLLGEQFNWYDGESTYQTTLFGKEYWYFDQS